MFRRLRKRVKRESGYYTPDDDEIDEDIIFDEDDNDIFCCGQAMDVDTFYGYNECKICGKIKPLTLEQQHYIKQWRPSKKSLKRRFKRKITYLSFNQELFDFLWYYVTQMDIKDKIKILATVERINDKEDFTYANEMILEDYMPDYDWFNEKEEINADIESIQRKWGIL